MPYRRHRRGRLRLRGLVEIDDRPRCHTDRARLGMPWSARSSRSTIDLDATPTCHAAVLIFVRWNVEIDDRPRCQPDSVGASDSRLPSTGRDRRSTSMPYRLDDPSEASTTPLTSEIDDRPRCHTD